MNFHTPVLLKETLEYLDVQPGKKYIDATLGGGGHAAAILRSGGEVLGIDMDPNAVRHARNRVASEVSSAGRRTNFQFSIVRGNFKRIDEIAEEQGFEDCDGILFDLGMSSWQLDESERGFSFMSDEELDMRMDPSLEVTAKDLLKGLKKNELNKLFSKYAQENNPQRFVHALTRTRRVRDFETTKEFSGLLAWVELDEPRDFWNWYENNFKNDPGKYGSYDRRARFFQALRIAVNDEINNLEAALPRALRILAPGGRLVVITFHSLERGGVKKFAARQENELHVLTGKPVTASEEEVEKNQRARSARLLAYKKNISE